MLCRHQILRLRVRISLLGAASKVCWEGMMTGVEWSGRLQKEEERRAQPRPSPGLQGSC